MNTGSRWKVKPSGCVQVYPYQDELDGEVYLRHAADPFSGVSVTLRLPKVCMDCGDKRPRDGFAPVFNSRDIDKPGESFVLVCNPCYDKRCAQEAKLERERQEWLDKDNHRRQQNREACQRWREKQKQQQSRKAG